MVLPDIAKPSDGTEEGEEGEDDAKEDESNVSDVQLDDAESEYSDDFNNMNSLAEKGFSVGWENTLGDPTKQSKKAKARLQADIDSNIPDSLLGNFNNYMQEKLMVWHHNRVRKV